MQSLPQEFRKVFRLSENMLATPSLRQSLGTEERFRGASETEGNMGHAGEIRGVG